MFLIFHHHHCCHPPPYHWYQLQFSLMMTVLESEEKLLIFFPFVLEPARSIWKVYPLRTLKYGWEGHIPALCIIQQITRTRLCMGQVTGQDLLLAVQGQRLYGFGAVEGLRGCNNAFLLDCDSILLIAFQVLWLDLFTLYGKSQVQV